MSAKKKSDWTEAVHNAATGYAVVVLSVVCFLLALVVIIAGVRVIAGSSSSGVVPVTASTAASVTGATGNGKT